MIAGIPKNQASSKNPAFPPGRPEGPPRRTLELSPERERYEQDFQHQRVRFLEQLGGLTRRELRIQSLFRPGVDGRPVLDSSGFVFWRARFVLHAAAERKAHEIMPELYRSWLRRPLDCLADPNAWSPADSQIVAALLNYACWSGRPVWLDSIAALFDQAGATHSAADRSYELAALLAASNEATARADYYFRLVTQPGPYFSFAWSVLRNRSSSPASSTSASAADGESGTAPPEEGGDQVSVKRLLWAEAAITEDRETEAYLLRRMTKNPPVDEDELLDLYRSLALRGRLFRAARLLLRHQRHFGEKGSALRLLLQLYLNNGKYLYYLRALRRAEIWPGRSAYYEAVYCIHRLGLQNSEEQLMTRIMADKQELKLPPDEMRYRMRTALDVAQSGHPPVLGAGREEWGDLVENHYLLEGAARSRGALDGALIRERFRLFQASVHNLLENDGGEEPRRPERLSFYFRTLMWTFEQFREREELDELWPRLLPLAGENLALRLFFGIMLFEREEVDRARRFLDGQAGQHPALLHAKSELAMLADDFELAERAYRQLLRLFPDSATLKYNLGLILERAYRLDEALAIFREVLELDPRNQEVYEKVQLLS